MAEEVPPRDRTLAIVLGASEWPRYPEFQTAPSFKQSLSDVTDYLCDPNGLALADENVHAVIDSHKSASTIVQELHGFLRERCAEMERAGAPATDLLFYYVGHGVLSPGNVLHFTLRATSANDPFATSISVDSLSRLIRDSAASLRSYLVLDCCFAAAAIRAFMSPASDWLRAQVADGLPSFRAALLCAAGPRETAQAPAGSRHTMFSGALLSVLRDGDARAADHLSLKDLRDLVTPVLTKAYGSAAVVPQLHEPRQRAERVEEVPLFPNPAQRGSRPDSFWAPETPLKWAHDWGTDQYGRWVRFSVPTKAGGPLLQRMRWAPPGTFMMGSPPDEEGRFKVEGPQHRVTFAQGFWMFDTACTEALWQAVTGEVPDPRRGPEFPVTNVSWHQARAFIENLNRVCPGISLVLPSEAQWEYCCRAGTTTPYNFGNYISPALVRYGSDGPVVVASLPANPWGLYEMHGNVWEWCSDSWHSDYTGAPADGSVWGGGGAAADRVLRGGSWNGEARHVRSAVRFVRDPADRDDDFGFRCARVQ